jgi:hypothetical protein
MKKFDGKNGDIFTLEEYFKEIEEHNFIDYDGYVRELLDKDNNIVKDGIYYPSEIKELKKVLKNNQTITKVVWYNR